MLLADPLVVASEYILGDGLGTCYATSSKAEAVSFGFNGSDEFLGLRRCAKGGGGVQISRSSG